MNKQIDFYVDVIDNYWDIWFALTFARILIDTKNVTIRFFSNDENLFRNMLWYDNDKILYYDSKLIFNTNPSNIIYNFFDKKINFEYLDSFWKKITIINFWYFLLHKWVENLHGTTYERFNITVKYIIPSLLQNTWWILIPKVTYKFNRSDFLKFISEKYNINIWNINTKIATVFVYNKTIKTIIDNIWISNKKITYFIFWYPELQIIHKNIICMPFLHLNDYEYFLSISDFNIVRGENSFVQSILHSKPTLWDIYKEDNWAHIDKINDYLLFISQISWYNHWYDILIKQLNWLDINTWFITFSESYEKYMNMFHSLGNHIHTHCNLYKNIKKGLCNKLCK